MKPEMQKMEMSLYYQRRKNESRAARHVFFFLDFEFIMTIILCMKYMHHVALPNTMDSNPCGIICLNELSLP